MSFIDHKHQSFAVYYQTVSKASSDVNQRHLHSKHTLYVRKNHKYVLFIQTQWLQRTRNWSTD